MSELSDGDRGSRSGRGARAHKDRPPGKLGDVLKHYLTDARVLDVSYEHVVPALWGQVAGEWYARHTSVTRGWEGVVDVECDSAARAQQLQLDSTEIIRRLNAKLGAQYVRQIRPSSAGGSRTKPFTAAHGDRIGRGNVDRCATRVGTAERQMEVQSLETREHRGNIDRDRIPCGGGAVTEQRVRAVRGIRD